MAHQTKNAAQIESAGGKGGFRLTLSRKVTGALVASALITASAVGAAAYFVASDTAREHATSVLKENVYVRHESFGRLAKAIESDIRFLALSPETAHAVEKFSMEFETRVALEGFEAIQRAYIADNPHPIGEKHLLDEAPTNTGYDAFHAKEHPSFREFLLGRGYYDIFLISNKGDVVYSVYKELDFATNVVDGAYKDSGLGRAFRAAAKLDAPTKFAFDDFAAYAPSAGAPAAFVAAPVFDHHHAKIGVVVAQLPVDRIAETIKSHDGIISYVAGSDGVLRSDLPSTEANEVLSARIDKEVAHLADGKPAGEVVTAEAIGVLGEKVLIAETGVDFLGAHWSLISEEPLTVIEGPITELRNLLLGVTAPIVFVIAALSLLVGSSISRPVRALSAAVARLARNEAVEIPGVTRSDEVGDLARGLNSINDAAEYSTRVKAALDSGSAPTMVVDRDFNIAYANAALQETMSKVSTYLAAHGGDAHNLVGASLDIFYDNPSEVRSRLQSLETSYEADISIENREFGTTMSPVRNSAGEKIGYVVEWRDVTDQRNAEREINATISAVAAGDFSRQPQVNADDHFIQEAVSGLTRICGIVDGFVSDVDRSVSAIAHGDLSRSMSTSHEGRYKAVAESVNSAIAKLSSLVTDIKTAESTMRGQITTVESGSSDLASRAENQASSLEETAATMEEMSATISANADSATRATGLATEARDKAVEGDGVVSQAVDAMGQIEASSEQITDIISVIDSIAFQTNLLALNAAVEAARAGDAGKGFAVVASEVRTLAQRSADAARDIKELITVSSNKVSDGVKLVRATGESLVGIRDAINRVSESIGEISNASREQATGVSEISSAVAHMDEMTQQNSTLAEQSASSARGLAEEAERLGQLMSFFQVGGGAPASMPARRRSENAADAEWQAEGQRAATPPMAAASGTDWAEF